MREVIESASAALTIRIFGTFLGFVVSLLIARQLGAGGSGVYFLAISVVTIASTVSLAGFDNTVVRFIASYALKNEWYGVRFVYRIAIIVVSVASLLVTIFLFLGAEWIANSLFEKTFMELPLRLMSLAVLPQTLAMIQADSLRGLKDIPASQGIKTVYVSLCTLILLYPFIQWWGVNGAVAAYLSAVVVTSVVARGYWNKALHMKEKPNSNIKKNLPLKPLFQSSWPLFGVALTGLVVQQTAIIFLGIWGTAEDVGVFNVAYRISSLLIFPLMAMISILSPKFAEMHLRNDMEGLEKLAKDCSKMLAFFAVPIAILVAILSEWIMGLFGLEFTRGAIVLNILLVGVVTNTATGAVGEILMMSGYETDVRRVLIVSALVIVVLCVCLMPHFGVIGAAISVTIGMCVQNCYMVVAVRQSLGFWPIGFFNN